MKLEDMKRKVDEAFDRHEAESQRHVESMFSPNPPQGNCEGLRAWMPTKFMTMGLDRKPDMTIGEWMASVKLPKRTLWVRIEDAWRGLRDGWKGALG